MPDDILPSKPRRRGLWWPYVALIIGLAGWSLVWLVLRGQIENNIDRTATTLRDTGYAISWKARRISGYPFRFEIEMTDVKAAEPSGWGLAAPRLKAVAAAYEIDHWVFVADDGVTLWRPASGPVDIGAEVMRASIADARRAPRFSLEGRKLTFKPRAGEDAFPFTAAEGLEIHLRPKDGDGTELLWRLDGAATRRSGLFAQVAPLAPLSVRLGAHLDKRGQFKGRDWADAVRNWTAAGGAITVDQLQASVGDVSVTAKGGPLTVGYDGRLRGELGLTFRQGAAALAALGAVQGVDPTAAAAAATVAGARGYGEGAQLQLGFEAGSSTIGPVRIGAAPRVY